MREIKFRAWIKYDEDMVDVLAINWKAKEILYEGESGWKLIWNRGNSDLGLFKDVELMQHTGLHDKNGKEIYEGDIITHSNDGMTGVITWSEGLYRFVIENLKQTEIIADLCDYDFEPEIIGNIYENKELLK